MPKPRKTEAANVQVTVTLPAETWRRLKMLAIERDRLMRDVVLDAIRRYLRSARAKA